MDLTVFIVDNTVTCSECQMEIGPQAWIRLGELDAYNEKSRQPVANDKKVLCLACADLDYLTFLAAGDAALSRRARKHSTLSAVVLRWNKRRKRYERQGLLVEPEALDQAEQECLADSDVRARRRERDAVRRDELDQQYVKQFAECVRQLFPGCPADTENVIAAHACLKYSGRVGRSASAKELDEKAVRLAVIAHIRHTQTDYDSRLAAGQERAKARVEIQPEINRVLDKWGSLAKI